MAESISEGYTAPWYYNWILYDDGSKLIMNYSYNYVHKKYDDGRWYMTSETVSGNGVNLTGGAGNDSLFITITANQLQSTPARAMILF